jgi:hypothetical protein
MVGIMGFRKSCAVAFITASLIIGTATSIRAQERLATVNGYVLDSACAFVKNLDQHVSAECALSCANAGSPLVILADDSIIYWPISDSMPAKGQNPRLMKFAGQKVSVTGKVFERSGSRALVIERIEPESTEVSLILAPRQLFVQAPASTGAAVRGNRALL